MRFEFTVQIGDDDHDVAVDTPGPLRLGEVWPRLLAVLGSDGHLRASLAADTALGSRSLTTGSAIRAGATDAPSDAATGTAGLALHVVGGRDAGRVVPLRPGSVRIGRDPHCGIVLHDERVSRRHVTVRVDSAGVSLHDDSSTNGTTIEAVPLGSGDSVLPIGAVARIGDTLLSVRDRDEAALPVERSGDRHRITPVPRPAEPRSPVLDVASRPPRTLPRPTQWLAALLPAVAGGGLAWLTHSPTFLLFALLSPVMLLGTTLGERLHRRRSQRTADVARSARSAGDRRAVAALLEAETMARRARHPDPVLVGRAATVPTARLWQRRRGDEDVLVVRFGSAASESDTGVRRDGVIEPAGRLFAVPVTVDLRDGPVGFAGPREVLDGLARCLVAQLAVLHPPSTVELALFLLDAAGERRWSWARWLPHLADRVARTAPEWDELAERLAADTSSAGGPRLVAVVDRSAAPAVSARLSGLLVPDGSRSVTALAFADTVAELPPWCARTVELWEPADDTVVDRVSPVWADQVARALAPLSETTVRGTGPPAACHLLDVLGLAGPTVDEVRARWAASGGRAGTPLGMTADGQIDLDLDRDGPHALVAGTTGSGKSELLRTLVLGLAVQHPPDELTFVLVDYKGGAAFTDCAGLPHTVGTVTDLDPHLTRRALQSLEAELRRRERLFAAAGAGDLDGYRRTAAPAIARLVIVVDEFAALADTQPDFLHGLVSVARRGRSLGVHLVLATQRPGVAVTPEIRANTACRIALRVIEPAESTDVIGVPDAADLATRRPGRALLRVDGATVEFQAAGVDGVARRRPPGLRVERLGPWRRSPTTTAGDPDSSSALVVATVRLAAIGRESRPGPWLPPLPERLTADALTMSLTDAPTDSPSTADRVPFAMVDVPSEQRQDVLGLSLRTPSSWLVVGGPRSGRTSTLLSVAVAAAGALSPSELEIYVIDGGGALEVGLHRLPHVATVLGPSELSATGTVLRRLADRSPGTASTLVLIDDAERLLASAEDVGASDHTHALAALLASRRATVMTTASRALLSGRLAGGFQHRLLLALPDRADYALSGVPAREVPATMPPGRALRTADGLELQIVLPDPAAVDVLAERWAGVRSAAAIRIRPLPGTVERQDLPALPGRLRLGVAGESADPVQVDPFGGSRRWLVAGPARSGRTTALLTLLAEAHRVGVPTLVAAPHRSALSHRARLLGVPTLAPVTEPIEPPTAATLVLVDDCESFLGTPVDDVLAAWVREHDELSFVVAGRSEELAAAYRGLAAEVRHARSGLLLRPGPLDGELLDVRLPRAAADAPAGRGVLVADSGWYVGAALQTADGPVPIQVARP